MTSLSISAVASSRRYGVWLIGVSFVLFQFFLQLSSGVVIGALMHDIPLTSLAAGLLSSAFYYAYTAMQIPVGMLFDRKNARLLLTVNALLCSLGCFFFAQSHSLFFLIMARLLIGTGSSFAFVGLSHLLREYFPLRKFGFMIGLSETLGFLATVIGMMSMGALIHQWGWRSFINGAGCLGLVIAALCWHYIDTPPPASPVFNYKSQFGKILFNSRAWINGFFVGLSFTVITVFGAMWAVPFLQVKLNCSLQTAGFIDAMIFLGAAVSCPLFGWLANFFKKRKPLLWTSCLSTASLLLVVLYAPLQNYFIVALIMFLIGVCCGAYMLAFSIANELAPRDSLSTCTGFTNTLAMLTAPIMQPFVGYLLDLFSNKGQDFSISHYQSALLIIPLNLLLASGLIFLLPEKK